MKRLFILLFVMVGLVSYSNAQNTIYVDENASGADDGSSWSDAYNNLQDALMDTTLQSGDQIFVAGGMYQTTNPGEFFKIPSGISIYGGFEGTESSLLDRDINNFNTNPSTLVGNDSTVVVFDSITDITILDGFSVEGGFTSTNGGGIIVSNSNSFVTLSNLIIQNNIANLGGGIYIESSSPSIKWVTVTENIADNNGGGIYNNNASPTLVNVLISGNTADSGNGGGIYNQYDSLATTPQIISNVTISGNLANMAGGIYISDSTDNTTIINSIISGNNNGDIEAGSILNLLYYLSQANVKHSVFEVLGNVYNWTDANNVVLLDITSDDIFTDAQNDDYSLQCFGHNPAIDNGVDSLYIGNAGDNDLAYNDRFIGTSIDLGAFEFQHTMTLFAANATLEVCADSAGANPTGSFDLTTAKDDINNMAGLTFEYYSDSLHTSIITDSTNYIITGQDTVYVKIFADSICYDYSMLILNVKPLPSMDVTATPALNICVGDSVSLTMSGTGNYVWDNADLNLGNAVTPIDTTNYKVIGNLNGCVDSAIITVNVNAIPVISTTLFDTTCANSPITLTATGADSFEWSDAAITNGTPFLATDSIYTVYGVTNGCHSDTLEVAVLIKNAPVITLTPSTIDACNGQDVMLEISGLADELNFNGSVISNDTTLVLTPTSATTYTVFGSLGDCVDSSSVNITIKDAPTADSISVVNNAECSNTFSVKNAANVTSYLWNFGDFGATSNSSSTTYNYQDGGKYTVTVMLSNECGDLILEKVVTCSKASVEDLIVDFQIFPNPTSSYISIANNSGINIDEVTIFNNLGQVVYSQSINATSTDLNVSNFADGFYTLQIKTVQGNVMTKIEVLK